MKNIKRNKYLNESVPQCPVYIILYIDNTLRDTFLKNLKILGYNK